MKLQDKVPYKWRVNETETPSQCSDLVTVYCCIETKCALKSMRIILGINLTGSSITCPRVQSKLDRSDEEGFADNANCRFVVLHHMMATRAAKPFLIFKRDLQDRSDNFTAFNLCRVFRNEDKMELVHLQSLYIRGISLPYPLLPKIVSQSSSIATLKISIVVGLLYDTDREPNLVH